MQERARAHTHTHTGEGDRGEGCRGEFKTNLGGRKQGEGGARVEGEREEGDSKKGDEGREKGNGQLPLREGEVKGERGRKGQLPASHFRNR